MKVLIIEDDPDWALTLERMVNDFGYQVVGIANSIIHARELLKIQSIDLVLCNIIIDNENAVDLFLSPPLTNYPVIFITNSTDETYYKQANQLKRTLFLVKPFHVLTLKSIIEFIVGETNAKETTKSLLVRVPNGQRILVPFETIYWISVEKNYCFFITQTKKYALKTSLNRLIEQLDDRFVQTHKGFCINSDFITRTDLAGSQIFVNNEAIPIGYKYRKTLVDFLARKSY